MIARIADAWRVLASAYGHPLNRSPTERWSSVLRAIRWQIVSRLHRGPLAVDWVNGLTLLLQRRVAGREVYYLGLPEFIDMCFVVHFLRPEDIFIDIGANVGEYSLLAAGVSGAEVLAIEPVPRTCEHLRSNVRLNNLSWSVEVRSCALGRVEGPVVMTANVGAANHVIPRPQGDVNSEIRVEATTLDRLLLQGYSPTLIKIDVEGFEAEVIAGGSKVLRSPQLLAVVIEQQGHGVRYGADETQLARSIEAMGFTGALYDPWTRTLTPATQARHSENRLFVRDFALVRQRVAAGPPIALRDWRI